jgi:hypothetical protein
MLQPKKPISLHVAGALDFVFVRIDFRFDEGADRIHDHLLLVGQCEIHDIPPSIFSFAPHPAAATFSP